MLEQPLRFEILGPMRAWRGDQELDLGPAKQRAVLAVLLTHANKPVQTSRIVEEVWDDDRPENGANVVQKYVAGLRRVLEPDRQARAPGQLLTLTHAGYLLRVEAGRLDVDVFTGLVRQARAAKADDSLPAAARWLGDAVGLWRAEAMAGLPEPLLRNARKRLNEMRVAALEESAELELELGRHGRVVPELVRLVTEYPLREQLRYLLMLGLYRCGRQAEAYAAYRDARRLLVEEFGVEPSKRLRLLNEQMLKTDPVLEWRGAGVPAQVPVSPATELSLVPPTVLHPGWPGAAPADRPGLAQWCTRIIAVGVPILSFGMLTWAVIAYFAGNRRSVRLGLAAGGYFALLVVTAFTLMTNEETDAVQPSETIGLLALFVSMLGGAVHAALVNLEPPAQRCTEAPARSGHARAATMLGRFVVVAVPLLSVGFLTWLVVAAYAARRRSLTLALAAVGYLGLIVLLLMVFAMNADSPVSTIDGIWLLGLFLTAFGGTTQMVLLTSDAYRLQASETDEGISAALRAGNPWALPQAVTGVPSASSDSAAG